jgi:hypothetical protein
MRITVANRTAGLTVPRVSGGEAGPGMIGSCRPGWWLLIKDDEQRRMHSKSFSGTCGIAASLWDSASKPLPPPRGSHGR